MKKLIITSMFVCCLLGSFSTLTANAQTNLHTKSQGQRVYLGAIDDGVYKISLYGDNVTGEIEIAGVYDYYTQTTLEVTSVRGTVKSGLVTAIIHVSNNGDSIIRYFDEPLTGI